MQDNANFDLFYDTHHVATTTSVKWEPHSLHCTCEVVDSEASGEKADWSARIATYIRITREAHRLQLNHEHRKADEFVGSSREFLDTFGSHLWHIVQNESGTRSKIRAPFFGVDGYLRIAFHPSRISYELQSLQEALQTRIVLMAFAASNSGDTLSKEQLQAHLSCLAQCMQVALRVPKAGDGACNLVDEFFLKLHELDSPIQLFRDPNARMRLDQTCASES